jgi:hypothetical protein
LVEPDQLDEPDKQNKPDEPDRMNGDAPMTQETILVLLAGLIGVLFAVLVGFLWIMIRAALDDDHDTHDNRQGSVSPEPRDGEEAHEGSPRQSKVAA